MHVMADRIRQARRLRNLSQTQLAETVGVQRSAVAQWERTGGTHPSVEHLAQVAVATHVYFEWLATGRGAVNADASVALERAASMPQTDNFAKDEVESNILQLMRKLSPRRRSAAYQLLRAMVG
jgi:transcriptional regulator with XRE-family HTH domain